MSRKPEASRVFACAAIVTGASPGEARHCFFGDETVLRGRATATRLATLVEARDHEGVSRC